MTTLPPLRAMLPWLTAQPWQRVIGRRVDCHHCPIAYWLQVVYEKQVTVDEETILVEDDTGLCTRFDTPVDFRGLIDRIDYAGIECREVTVQETYEALKAVLQEMGDYDQG